MRHGGGAARPHETLGPPLLSRDLFPPGAPGPFPGRSSTAAPPGYGPAAPPGAWETQEQAPVWEDAPNPGAEMRGHRQRENASRHACGRSPDVGTRRGPTSARRTGPWRPRSALGSRTVGFRRPGGRRRLRASLQVCGSIETARPPQGRAAPGYTGDAPATMAGAEPAATRRRAVPSRPRAPRPVHLPRQARPPSRCRPFGPPTATNRRSGPGRSRGGGRPCANPGLDRPAVEAGPGMPAPRERRRALPVPGHSFGTAPSRRHSSTQRVLGNWCPVGRTPASHFGRTKALARK